MRNVDARLLSTIASNEDGGGAVFNFSRAVIYAYQSPGSTYGPEQYADAAREAAGKYRAALNTALAM